MGVLVFLDTLLKALEDMQSCQTFKVRIFAKVLNFRLKDTTSTPTNGPGNVIIISLLSLILIGLQLTERVLYFVRRRRGPVTGPSDLPLVHIPTICQEVDLRNPEQAWTAPLFHPTGSRSNRQLNPRLRGQLRNYAVIAEANPSEVSVDHPCRPIEDDSRSLEGSPPNLSSRNAMVYMNHNWYDSFDDLSTGDNPAESKNMRQFWCSTYKQTQLDKPAPLPIRNSPTLPCASAPTGIDLG